MNRPAQEQQLRLNRFWWIAGWVIVVLVTWGSLRPEAQVPHSWSPPDKVMHFSAYCTMAFWFAGMTRRRLYPFMALLLLVFGGCIEIAQGFMGYGRDADWHDLLANAMGIGTALILAYAGLGSWMAKLEHKWGLS